MDDRLVADDWLADLAAQRRRDRTAVVRQQRRIARPAVPLATPVRQLLVRIDRALARHDYRPHDLDRVIAQWMSVHFASARTALPESQTRTEANAADGWLIGR